MKNQMNRKQFLRLARYVEAHGEQLHAERPSYAEVARRASSELGFACTESNIRAAADACDLTWTARRTAGPRASSKYVNRILARGIVEIADALDIKVDQDLRRIACGRRVEGGRDKEADAAC